VTTSRPSLEEIRRRSKDLFRNGYMLEVCAAIDSAGGRVNLSALVEGTGLSPSLYSGPIRRLAGLRLLLDDPKPGDDYRERWYLPADSQLWVAARQLTLS